MPKLKLKKAMPTNTPESSGKSKFNQITNKEDHSNEAVQEKPKTLWDIVDHEQDFHMLYSGVEDERNFFVEIRNYPHRLLSKKESVQSVVKSNIRIINLSAISCWCFYNILHGHLPAPPKNCCIAFCLF